MTDSKHMEKAREVVEALFKDIRGRRFLKWLFPAFEGAAPILHERDGTPLMPLELDVQEEIKAAWGKIIATAVADAEARGRNGAAVSLIAQKDRIAELEARLQKAEAEKDAAEFAARNGRSLSEDSIHAIRELLNEAGVPRAAFIDDHVGNAVAQRNQEKDRADALAKQVEAYREALAKIGRSLEREVSIHRCACQHPCEDYFVYPGPCGTRQAESYRNIKVISDAALADSPAPVEEAERAALSEHDGGGK